MNRSRCRKLRIKLWINSNHTTYDNALDDLCPALRNRRKQCLLWKILLLWRWHCYLFKRPQAVPWAIIWCMMRMDSLLIPLGNKNMYIVLQVLLLLSWLVYSLSMTVLQVGLSFLISSFLFSSFRCPKKSEKEHAYRSWIISSWGHHGIKGPFGFGRLSCRHS